MKVADAHNAVEAVTVVRERVVVGEGQQGAQLRVPQIRRRRRVFLGVELLLIGPGYEFLQFSAELLLAQPLAVGLELAARVQKILVFAIDGAVRP